MTELLGSQLHNHRFLNITYLCFRSETFNEIQEKHNESIYSQLTLHNNSLVRWLRPTSRKCFSNFCPESTAYEVKAKDMKTLTVHLLSTNSKTTEQWRFTFVKHLFTLHTEDAVAVWNLCSLLCVPGQGREEEFDQPPDKLRSTVKKFPDSIQTQPLRELLDVWLKERTFRVAVTRSGQGTIWRTAQREYFESGCD
jgi:hypothetical protein